MQEKKNRTKKKRTRYIVPLFLNLCSLKLLRVTIPLKLIYISINQSQPTCYGRSIAPFAFHRLLNFKKVLMRSKNCSTNEHLNPEMERVLVEGTVKEAWGQRFKNSKKKHKRDRVFVLNILPWTEQAEFKLSPK